MKYQGRILLVSGRDRGFLVATEFFLVLCCDKNSYLTTWFSGFKRQGLAMGEGLVLQHDFFFSSQQRLSKEGKFYVAIGHSLSRQRELLVRAIPCHDRAYCVAIGNGGNIRFSVVTGLFVSR